MGLGHGTTGFSFLHGLFAFLIVCSMTAASAAKPQARTVDPVATLIAKHKFDEAEQQLWAILTKAPDDLKALDWMAQVRVLQQRVPEAEALYRRVLALAPNDVTALRGLGELYHAQRKAAEAIECFEGVLAASPGDRSANESLAFLYQQAHKFEESIAAAERLPSSGRPPRLLPVLADDYFSTNEP